MGQRTAHDRTDTDDIIPRRRTRLERLEDRIAAINPDVWLGATLLVLVLNLGAPAWLSQLL